MDNLFVCLSQKGRLTLTADACGKLFTRAGKSNVKSDEMLGPCRYCELGAYHAGGCVDERKACAIDTLCTRCHRPADRFIYRRLCLSCYNRWRELVLGEDRRGRPPKNHPAIKLQPLGVVTGSSTNVRTVPSVTGLEAMMTLVKQSPQRLVLVRPVFALQVV